MQTLSKLLLLGCLSSPLLAAEPILLNLVVNGVEQGDVDAIYDHEGYWIAEQSLRDSGINTLRGTQQTFETRAYFRTDALEGIQSRVDTSQLRVYLDAAASEFGEKAIALNNSHAQQWPVAADLSAYLSYKMALTHQSDASGVDYEFSPTLNLNAGHWHFRSEHDYSSQARAQQWLRLRTVLEYDRPELMLRATAGDLNPRSGALGFSQSMAGIGFSRVFAMQPDFASAPSLQTQAAITRPSSAEIYLNGQRIKTLQLQPGVYQFNDLRYFSGLQNVEVLIKDGFGSSQTIRIPYYFDDTLLKAGLNEFDYNLGIRRVNGSFERYDGLAYSAYHRIGLSDWLTLGGQASGNPDDSSYGLLLNLKLGNLGTLASAASWSHHDQQAGGDAQQVQYRYVNPRWSLYANFQRQSTNYWRKNEFSDTLGQMKWSASIGTSWGSTDWGNWSLEYGQQHGDSAAATFKRYQIGHAISPLRNTSINSQIRLLDGAKRDWSGYINVSWYFGQGHSLYGGTQYRNGQYLPGSTLSKSTPNGEGWGYSLSVQQQEQGTDYIGWLENKMRHGQASLTYTRNDSGTAGTRNNWRASWQGALAYADQTLGLTRAINDSFALVELGLPDVGVTQNGAEVGKTDASGRIFIPEVSSFSHQQLGLKQEDIPLEYSIDRLQKELLTGNQSGQTVQFQARRVQAVSGQLLQADGQPLANQRVTARNEQQTVHFSTAMDGRFYTEALEPGRYTLSSAGCSALLELAPSSEIVTELAPISCRKESTP